MYPDFCGEKPICGYLILFNISNATCFEKSCDHLCLEDCGTDLEQSVNIVLKPLRKLDSKSKTQITHTSLYYSSITINNGLKIMIPRLHSSL